MARSYQISYRDVSRAIHDQQIRFVDLKFVDLFGTLQHLTIPANKVSDDVFQRGFGFDGSSVRGFRKISESDMILLPDANSMFRDPFFDEPALSFFCDIVDPNGHQPYDRDPRGIARKAERLLRAEGIADAAFFGPELEFFIFDDVRFDQATQHGYYFLNSSAAFWATGEEKGPGLGHQAARKGAYFAAPPVDHYNNLRSKISDTLELAGLEPELHHHEVAAAGQCEIGFRFGPLLLQADNAVKYKYIVKNVVDRYGKTATFMPKPLLQENGSGMHINVSLSKGDRNLFYEPGRYADLSETAIHFIGGLLRHAPALCAICAPTTNSYRRLVPGYEAPMNLVYSRSNRSACIRIPMMASTAKSKRIEFRTPDPSSNPYLAFSSVLLAGIDGIRNRIVPPDPIDEDIYELAETERGRSIQRTPASLSEALGALESDHEFLVRDGVFSPELIQGWIEYKIESEVDYVRLRPHPGEFNLYFNV